MKWNIPLNEQTLDKSRVHRVEIVKSNVNRGQLFLS